MYNLIIVIDIIAIVVMAIFILFLIYILLKPSFKSTKKEATEAKTWRLVKDNKSETVYLDDDGVEFHHVKNS